MSVVERIIRIDGRELERSLALTPEDRLRQANAAFRLYHELHRPYERPFVKGFDRLEDLAEFEKEARLPR